MSILWGRVRADRLRTCYSYNPRRWPVADPIPVVIWYFTDSKPGHESQIHGLLQALAKRLPVQAYPLPVSNVRHPLLSWMLGRARWAAHLPDPDFVVGAGHATHIPMLAAQRERGGRTIVLMKPSLPLRLFDLVVVPSHDKVAPAPNVFVSQGVLNSMQPALRKDPGFGIILLGGPSTHYRWDTDAVVQQIRLITERENLRKWLVTTSRRTPDGALGPLQDLERGNLQFIPFAQTKPGWVGRQLALASTAWITEDSVSMIYEALTAGANCGVLQVPRLGRSRVSRGIDRLIRQGLLTSFREWKDSGAMKAAAVQFNEAERCAGYIDKRWLSKSP